MWAQNLTVLYPGRSSAAVEGFTASVAPGESLVLRTASGTGKSTILAALAGVLRTRGDGAAAMGGSLHVPAPEAIVFVSQHPLFTEDTVLAELALYAGGPAAGEVDETMLMGALASVNAAHLAQRTVVDCSPGELRRVAVARALARIAADPGVELALFDEPTAHLDPESAAAVRQQLAALKGSVAVVAATHDALLADMLGTTGNAAGTTSSARAQAGTEQQGTAQALGPHPGDAAKGQVSARDAGSELPPLTWRHLRHLPLRSPRFAAGVLVSVLAMLTRSGGALGTLVADVDELRDAVPRAVVPIPAAILSYGAVLLTMFLLVPEVAGIVIIVGILGLVVLPVLVLAAQRKASAAAAVHRVWLAGRVTTLLAAADQLGANGVGAAQTVRFVAEDAQVAKPLRRLAWADGFGQSAVTVLTAVAAVAVTVLAIGAGVDPRAAAVAALLMLALSEPLSQFIDAVSALPALATLMRRTLPLLDVPATVVAGQDEIEQAATAAAAVPVMHLAVEAVAARYPQAQEPVFSGVSGRVRRGQWWTVSGPSGSGKSTLLAVLLGFLRPEAGQYTLNNAPAGAATLARIAWCPQDAYLFNSTLRANLALAKPAASAPSDADLAQALGTVGLGPWFESLPLGLDTRVGPGGHHLSGGQRTRVSVARTLVAGADVVLLDEPTAHLGGDEAGELVRDLRLALKDAAVVLVTHDDELARSGDTHLRLGSRHVLSVAAGS